METLKTTFAKELYQRDEIKNVLLAAAPVAIHKLRQRIQRVDILYEGAFINVFIHLHFY